MCSSRCLLSIWISLVPLPPPLSVCLCVPLCTSCCLCIFCSCLFLSHASAFPCAYLLVVLWYLANHVLFHLFLRQPSVNGAPSDHPVFGWGGGGGRVYQKAYVEFFASEALLDKVLEACSSLPQLNYYAVSLLCSMIHGDVSYTANFTCPWTKDSVVKKIYCVRYGISCLRQ